MIRMFKCFVSCQGYFANIVTSKLPQLTVLVHVASLTPCHGLRSCHLTILNANGLITFHLDYAFSPFAAQMHVG
jgi:hypothetical protein